MKCQFCKEEIVDGAIKCKHCGSMQDTISESNSEEIKNDSTNTVECKYCGELIPEFSFWCKHCKKIYWKRTLYGLLFATFALSIINTYFIKGNENSTKNNASTAIYKKSSNRNENKITKLSQLITGQYNFEVKNPNSTSTTYEKNWRFSNGYMEYVIINTKEGSKETVIVRKKTQNYSLPFGDCIGVKYNYSLIGACIAKIDFIKENIGKTCSDCNEYSFSGKAGDLFGFEEIDTGVTLIDMFNLKMIDFPSGVQKF